MSKARTKTYVGAAVPVKGLAPTPNRSREMPKARTKIRGGGTAPMNGPASTRYRSAPGTTTVSAVSGTQRRATSRDEPRRVLADPPLTVDQEQLRTLIQDAVREVLDTTRAAAFSSSTSSAVGTNTTTITTTTGALPPPSLLADLPAGRTSNTN